MGKITVCLAKNIRILRKQRGLTQSALAKRAGISVIFLQGIECEKKWLSPATIAALAEALEVTQSSLFRDPENPNSRPSKKIKRQSSSLRHVPDDIYYALSTTCRHPSWKWDTMRWLFDGFHRANM